MGKVITFINEKGGTGKSSMAFNTAWELSKRNKKVLLIDMDGQRANLTFFVGIEKDDSMLTIKEIFEGKSVKDMIIQVKENLFIIPATTKVSFNTTAKISRFKKEIKSIKNEYDYIFIDVNPTPGMSHLLSLSASDYAIVVMLPDIASLEANEGIFETIEDIQESSNSDLRIMGLLFNKKKGQKNNLSDGVVGIAEEVAESMNTIVFNTMVRDCVLLSENIGAHEGITDYDPKHGVAEDIRKLVDEIEGIC